MTKVNDWWTRYVPPRERPQRGMRGFQFQNKPPAKVHPGNCVCYVCRDAALLAALERNEK